MNTTALHAFLTGAMLTFGSASGSFAAQPAVAAQPTIAVQPPVRDADVPNAVAGDGQMLARYVVEAISFKALNETGVDFLGSDEVVVRYAIGETMMLTGIYGSVDTGETHQLRSGQQCIFPAIDPDGIYNRRWSCNAGGASGPVNFQITLYEFDGFLRGVLTNPLQFCLQAGNDLLSSCKQLQSVAIGSGFFAQTEIELAQAMPTVGASVERVVPIGSAYQVTIRLTRMRSSIVPPVGDEPPLGPVEPSQPCVPTPGGPCP